MCVKAITMKTKFWYARDLMEKLGYAKWQNFVEVIDKAKISCQNAGAIIENPETWPDAEIINRPMASKF